MTDNSGVAIVGLACRLPGAAGAGQYWRNLRDGVEGISRFQPGELIEAGVPTALARHPRYVPARGVIERGDRFDRTFFGYSPAEAADMNPQHRVFLETSSIALDDAGIDPQRFGGWIGVFAGCDMMNLAARSGDGDPLARLISHDKDYLATRVAYKLGLRGPAITVQSACSTSLVAVHQAAQSLLGYECDAAIAGGASLWLPQHIGYLYEAGHIESADGHCRPFDAAATGTVAGNGVGAVVLRRLEDALRDGDRVIAVIRGSAINNDGAEKIGYTAPSFAGQRDVIRFALAQADVDPADIGYVEAHGTATPVGDPVEVAALSAAYRESTDRTGYCRLGAVKSNIGHTGSAAGVAGLIKTALMLRHRELVPTLHYQRPNPELELDTTPFQIAVDHRPWDGDGPLLAGLSAFGVGGTNAHAVLESPPSTAGRTTRTRPRVFCLSAAGPKALRTLQEDLAARLDQDDQELALDDVAWTLAAGRRRFAHRSAVVATERAEVASALRGPVPAARTSATTEVAFLFPGQGTLQKGFGAAAHRLLPVFRAVFDELAGQARDRFGVELETVLRPDADAAWLRDTAHQQLGLFALGYALARQFQEYGITPAAMLGHSVGEYVAATLAGVWTPAGALALINERGRAMRDTAPGRMLAVAAAPDEIGALLATRPELTLAVDGPRHSVLAGPPRAIEALLADGVKGRLLDTGHAFHSPLVRPAAERLGRAVAATPSAQPRLPFLSNLTGGWAEPDRVTEAGYWMDHLAGTVRLTGCAEALLAGSSQVFLELGPGRTMTRMLRGHPDWNAERLAVPVAASGPDDEEEGLLNALARLWERGFEVGITDLYGDDGPRRCALPPHPFEPTLCERPFTRTPGAGPRTHDAVLTIGDVPDELARTMAADSVRIGSLDPSELDRAVDEVTRDETTAPAIVVALPAADDALARLIERSATAGVRLVLLGRAPAELDVMERLRSSAAGTVSVWHLDDGAPPERAPAGDGVHVWRGSRWWTLEEEVRPPAEPALEELETADVEDVADTVMAPRDDAEAAIAEMWQELLGVARVGVHDNFFELGGHSLLATRLAARFRSRFETELSIKALLDNPTVAGMATLVPAGAGSGTGSGTGAAAGVHRAGAERAPVSFGQRRLWFLDQADLQAAYTIPVVLELSGRLDVPALRAAITEIVRRHEALRTVFPAHEGEPVQVVTPPAPVELPVVEFSGPDRAELHEELRRPFDLATGPLLRATLFRVDPTHHVLTLCMHHIITDGWSIDVVCNEMSAVYNALQSGTAAPLAELSVQYGDYALWQRQQLQDKLDAGLAYWKGQLAGAPPSLELPTDRPRPALQTYSGAGAVRRLSPELTDRLRRLSQGSGTTLYMTLLSALQALLHRYTGQRDICVGTPVAGRTEVEFEALVGFFVNTLVLRTELAGDTSFAGLLAQVRETTLNALAHQDVPFEKLVEELNPPRDPSRNPLFQVMFNLLNMPDNELRMTGLEIARPDLDFTTAQVDLTLVVYERPDGLDCHLDYNTDLFDAGTAGRMLGHLETLLTGFAADPTLSVADIDLLSEAERQLMLTEWNDTARPVERSTLPALFQRQVARTPQATAVVAEEGTLTYAELNGRANRLAHRLRDLGVGPESVVAVCLHRGVDLVTALLAVQKAGGAYLPLDPDYPADRRAYMLADSGAEVVITEPGLAGLVAEHTGAIVDAGADLAEWPAEDPAGGATLQTPAYVIYTSGSTGRPKGVVIEHRGIVNRLDWMQEAYRLDHTDRVLQKTPYSFDVSVWEFFWPLITGAALVMARPDGHRDPAYLAEVIAAEQITTIHFVPSMLRAFLTEPFGALPSLHRMLCSGEALPADLVTEVDRRIGCPLHNLYGPTEASVDVTAVECRPGEPVTIGRPITNTQVHVLDARLRPAPIGVPGELFLAGVQLARGYLNRPGLTADRFIPNPYGPPGSRLYRTGDLCRRRADGSIDYLGRLDHQVKIRGNRIELGEIETCLREHPSVGEAVVVARQDGHDTTLVGYFVAEPGEDAPDPGQWRAHVRETLPEYMVPSAFVELTELPLTSSGKVDRRALPAPEAGDRAARTQYTAPTTELEARIAALWAEVLGMPQVGIDDNFFELGGDSFKALRAVRDAGRSVGVLGLFKHPTVRAFAAQVEQAEQAERAEQAAPEARLLYELTPPREAVALSLVCLPFAGGGAIIYQPLAAALPANVALYALQPPGHDLGRPDEPRQPLAEVARRCAEEITATTTGPIALYGHSMGGAITIEVARLLEAAGADLAGVFVGGHFPVSQRPGGMFGALRGWMPVPRWTQEYQAREFFRAVGLDDVFDDSEKEFLTTVFLADIHDARDYYAAAYREPDRRRLAAPIVCVIGAEDRGTEMYEERYTEWGKFSGSVSLEVIPSAGHYFLKHQASELAAIIAAHLDEGADAARQAA